LRPRSIARRLPRPPKRAVGPPDHVEATRHAEAPVRHRVQQALLLLAARGPGGEHGHAEAGNHRFLDRLGARHFHDPSEMDGQLSQQPVGACARARSLLARQKRYLPQVRGLDLFDGPQRVGRARREPQFVLRDLGRNELSVAHAG
jgi:hypothetical protein